MIMIMGMAVMDIVTITATGMPMREEVTTMDTGTRKSLVQQRMVQQNLEKKLNKRNRRISM